MTRDQAIRKVLACLRMAASSNPNEAATALRQARALMDKYGVTEADAAAAEISESEAGTGFRGGMIPRSLVQLAGMVADGYRCEIVIHQRLTRTVVRFFGAGADAQVAAYAFTVLRRQLQADKAKHCARIRKRANRERRGEEFAFGWIYAVQRLFPKEALPDGREAAIKARMAQSCGETQKTAGKEITRGRVDKSDRWAGYGAGSRAQVNPGVGGGQRRLEG
jgi:hypothetical protein